MSNALPPLKIKSLSGQLLQIKKDLIAGDSSSLSLLLESVHAPEALVAVREQKLLFKVAASARPTIAREYKVAVDRLFADRCEAAHEANYADFAVLVADQRDRVAANLAQSLGKFPRVSSLELVGVAESLLTTWFEQIASTVWQHSTPEIANNREAGDLASASAISERALHELKGATNDVAFAAARAINEAFRAVDQHKTFDSGKAVLEGTAQALLRLIELAITWNSLEYAADQVSYGEWIVRSVQLNAPIEVVLDIRDPTLAFARMVGLRREAVFLTFGKERQSTLRPQFEKLLPDFLDSCVELIMSGASVRLGIIDRCAIEAQLRRALVELEPNDDLLLAAGSPGSSIAEDYIAALSVRWFSTIAEFAARNAPARIARKLTPIVTSTDTIASMLPIAEDQRLRVVKALDAMVQSPPVACHFQLLANPFVRLPDSRIAYIRVLDSARWTADIRAKWLKGGEIGRRFGRLWEQFFGNVLEHFGWRVLGRGIRIRQKGAILTDVDLLAARDGLLLVLQIKALAGQGMNAYDHWRNRKIIEEGARQAATAAACIHNDPQILNGVCSKKVMATIRTVQPAVLTNVHTFNGWKVQDVPVVSRNGLMTLLNGGVVTRHKPDHTIVDIQQFGRLDTRDGDEFVRLLLNPIDWEVAKESIEVSHDCKDMEGVRWQIPAVGYWPLKGDIPQPSERQEGTFDQDGSP